MSASSGGVKKLKMRHDNEGSIQQGEAYRKAGLISMNFFPNSGDLNPIETVWAQLRKDIAVREFEDLKHGRVVSKTAFEQRWRSS